MTCGMATLRLRVAQQLIRRHAHCGSLLQQPAVPGLLSEQARVFADISLKPACARSCWRAGDTNCLQALINCICSQHDQNSAGGLHEGAKGLQSGVAPTRHHQQLRIWCMMLHVQGCIQIMCLRPRGISSSPSAQAGHWECSTHQ